MRNVVKLHNVIDTRTGRFYSIVVVFKEKAKYFEPADEDTIEIEPEENEIDDEEDEVEDEVEETIEEELEEDVVEEDSEKDKVYDAVFNISKKFSDAVRNIKKFNGHTEEIEEEPEEEACEDWLEKEDDYYE